MVVLDAPTESDARRAAAELAAAGASRVLLFGSVARGDATGRSDIDLVAVFDDLDYSRRWGLRTGLSSAAEDAVGRPVDVHVTDRPEWARRTAAVSSSFEAGIAPDAVVLIDRPAGEVDWDKEIGLPDNNIDEALGRLDEAAKALTLMRSRLLPEEMESTEAQAFMDGDHDTESHWRNWRLMDVCSAGAMAVEASLKALAARAGTPTPHSHDIHRLLPLAGDRSKDAAAALECLSLNTLRPSATPYDDLTIWRQAGTYIADRPEIDLAATSRLAPLIARAAIEVAAIVADDIAAHAGGHPAALRARDTIEAATKILKTRDLLTGVPIDE